MYFPKSQQKKHLKKNDGSQKYAIVCLARGLAEMCKGVANVRVNSLLPGPTWTEGVQECKPKSFFFLLFAIVRQNNVLPVATQNKQKIKRKQKENEIKQNVHTRFWKDMKGVADKQNKSVEKAVAEYFTDYEPNSLKMDYLTTNEIANVCLFLSSDASSAIRGVAQKAEGGLIKHI